ARRPGTAGEVFAEFLLRGLPDGDGRQRHSECLSSLAYWTESWRRSENDSHRGIIHAAGGLPIGPRPRCDLIKHFGLQELQRAGKPVEGRIPALGGIIAAGDDLTTHTSDQFGANLWVSLD